MFVYCRNDSNVSVFKNRNSIISLPQIQIMKSLIFILVSFVSFQMAAQQNLTKADLKILKDRLEGNFDSYEQSRKDSSYYNILLHMKEFKLKEIPVKQKFSIKKIQMPQKKEESYWLYVEQAMASAPEKPYRQRIYHLSNSGDTVLISQIYEMNFPQRFVGAWNDVSKLSQLTIDSLIERTGCSMYMYKDTDGNFVGSTRGESCESSLKGAQYATSEVTIGSTMLISWDRGWDENAQQVWGATKGGYRFRKFIQMRKPKD